jgi:hypothetical protein
MRGPLLPVCYQRGPWRTLVTASACTTRMPTASEPPKEKARQKRKPEWKRGLGVHRGQQVSIPETLAAQSLWTLWILWILKIEKEETEEIRLPFSPSILGVSIVSIVSTTVAAQGFPGWTPCFWGVHGIHLAMHHHQNLAGPIRKFDSI